MATGLARHALHGVGHRLSAGEVTVWTFLVRTPEVVEAGLRQMIPRALPEHRRGEHGPRLRLTGRTLNPDFVFGTTLAVADVQYKIATSDWRRRTGPSPDDCL